MARPAALLMSALALGVALGCDGLEAPPKQQGEACTRSSQCVAPLVCLAGECAVEPPDASVDAATADAGP